MITYKIRIYPNKQQKELIDKFLWECKCLYNWYLECHQDVYRSTKLTCSKFDLDIFRKQFNCRYLPVNVQVMVAARVIDAYKRFFSGQNRYPKFKSINQYQSFTYGRYKHDFNFTDNEVRMTGLGQIKAVIDRPILGKPKTCTLKKMKTGKYYVFIAVEEPSTPITNQPNIVVGIDPGLEKFLTLSDGHYVRRPEFLGKQEQQKLAHAQRRLSRKKKGSKNYEKQRLKLARLHEHIANRRRDHHFKVAKFLVTNYGIICIEDLRSSFMIEKKKRKSKGMAKSAIDAALYEFRVILHQQADKYHSTIIDVDPRMTSQMCSKCGSIVSKDLSIRLHVCPHCGLTCDRDLNAAINILDKGIYSETGRKRRSTVGSTVTSTLVEIQIPGL